MGSGFQAFEVAGYLPCELAVRAVRKRGVASTVQLRCTTWVYNMAYLTRRGAVYYLNLRLPEHLFPRCHTLRLSLHIRHRQHALFLATSLAQQVHNHLNAHPMVDLRTLRRLCSEWRDSAPSPTIQPAVRKVPTDAVNPNNGGPTLATLSKLYIEEGKRGGTWREASTFEVERALRDLFDLMGDMPVEAFDAQQARLLKERLSRCPQYFGLRPEFKGKTLKQVVESGATYKTITAVTVNNRLRKLSAFLNWCKSNSYITDNPLAGLKMMTGASKEARLSFDNGDLRTLLDLNVLQAEAQKHPWRYWLPLLGRCTGARLEELCQLHVHDFIQQQGIQCIRIDDNSEGQNLKNASSRRLLPIHPTLIELGLLGHVESVRATGADRLFPELEPVRGKLGHTPSKWFGRYKKKRGITDPRKTFHSFRHTLIDDLRDSGVQDSLIKRIAGHEDGAVTFSIYGSRSPLKAMVDALRHIELGPQAN